MLLGDQTVRLEREWNEDGRRSKMLLNGERFPVSEVQALFLEKLGIPVLRYPQGNVTTSDRTWPSLGWRSLLRHIYRRQDFWGDLVPQQPESEQHACVLQFLGIAEHLFPDELSELVDKQKFITRLQAKKDHFVEVMHQVAPGIVDDQNVSAGLSAQSIQAASARVQMEINELINVRAELLTDVRNRTAPPSSQLAKLTDEQAAIFHQRNNLLTALDQATDRGRELEQYRSSLTQELDRLDRAQTAASIFGDIKITHCPACDQSVERGPRAHNHCFLCDQPTPAPESNTKAADARLQFERDQIYAELSEAEELIETIRAEIRQKRHALDEADRQLRQIELALRPFQAVASAILPAEVALTDQKIGSLNARFDVLQRLYQPLQTRDSLSSDIDALQAEVRRLEGVLAAKDEKIEFEAGSDRMSDGFNTYLNAIRDLDETSWTLFAFQKDVPNI
jgi:predicted  nucleic acid-binding Zn-ribbon protein